MKTMLLFLLMLRYRVAVMLMLFFLLGVAMHHKITVFSWNYVWGIVSLAASYIVATTVNDIADQKIDAVNHPNSKGRPLVNGLATPKDLIIVHVCAIALTLFLAGLINVQAVGVLALSLLINYIYSVKPLQLSYKTYFAPIILAIAYVVLPYWLGTIVAQASIDQSDSLFLCALFLMFAGRILLKDFRDQKGDAQYGKPTFVLRYGKQVTCITSLTLIILGNICLLISLRVDTSLVYGLVAIFCLTIYYTGYRLAKAQGHEAEQIAIGLGAKMGNGLLITILAMLVLQSYNAPIGQQIIFLTIVTAMYFLNFIVLIKKPEYAVVGYRG